MFEWDDARHFLAVQRTGSLSAAARQLQLNQSTVGRRITALERALGVLLFDRTPSGFRITVAGERFLPRAERMESEVHATALELGGQESQLTGTVRLTAPDAFGALFVTQVVAQFHKRYPDIAVELIADNRRLNLSRREADMAIRAPRPREASLVTRKLATLGYALYASRAYLARHGKPKNGELAGHDFIGFDEPFSSSHEQLWLEQYARRGRVVFKTNTTIGRLTAAISGMGISVLPCYLGDAERKLRRVLGPEQGPPLELWLVLHKDLRHAARIRACADFLVAAHQARAPRLLGMPSSR